MTLEDARFEIYEQLVALAAKNEGQVPPVLDVCFFLYPDPSRRLVLACAEMADCSADVEALFELPTPVDNDDFDEEACGEHFSTCLPAWGTDWPAGFTGVGNG